MKKFAITALSAIAVLCGTMGLAACTDKTDDKNADIYAVYQSYVAYAEDNSQTVLSYEDWLETIKGANGDRGEKGEKGDKGDDGKNGLNGMDGKSAYEIAVANGFKGTEAEWLASLKGTDGEDGSAGGKGDKGDDGLGIADIDVAYGTDGNGDDTVTYTFTMTDGSKIIKTVKIPKKITGVIGLEKSSFPKGAKPKFKVEVEYEDGSRGYIAVTDDMVADTDLNYNETGNYFVNIKVGKFKGYYYINIYDPSNPEVVSCCWSRNPNIIFTKEQIENRTLCLKALVIETRFADGTTETRNPEFDELQFSGKSGLCEITVAGVEGSLNAFIVENTEGLNLRAFTLWNSDTWQDVYCKQGEVPDLSEVYIASSTRIKPEGYDYEMPFAYHEPVTADMFKEDLTALRGGFSFIHIDGVSGEIEVFVYETKKEVYWAEYKDFSGNYYTSQHMCNVVESGVPELLIQICGRTEYFFEEETTWDYFDKPVAKGIVLTEDMLAEDVDFTVPGFKIFTIKYKDLLINSWKDRNAPLFLYDLKQSEISGIGYDNWGEPIVIEKGAPQAEVLATLAAHAKLKVTYWEKEYEEIDLTDKRVKIDYAGIDTSKGGLYEVAITFENKTIYAPLYIPVEFEGAKLVKTFTGTPIGAVGYDGFNQINLYDNGFAKLAIDGEEYEIPLTYFGSEDMLMLCYGETILCAFSVEDNTFAPYINEDGDLYTCEGSFIYICDVAVDAFGCGVIGEKEGIYLCFAYDKDPNDGNIIYINPLREHTNEPMYILPNGEIVDIRGYGYGY